MGNRIGDDYVFFIQIPIFRLLCSAQTVLFIMTHFIHREEHVMYISGIENNKKNTHVPTPQFKK